MCTVILSTCVISIIESLPKYTILLVISFFELNISTLIYINFYHYKMQHI